MNYKILKFFAVIIFLFLFKCHSFAQATQDSTETIADSLTETEQNFGDTSVSKIVFENTGDSIKKWRQNPQFAYMVFIDSLLKIKKGKLRMDTVGIPKARDKAKNSSTTSSDESSSPIFLNSIPIKIFFWLLAIVFIGIILYRLVIVGGLFEKKVKRLKAETEVAEPEKLNDYDSYNELITNAEKNNDYNLAIRYLYLQSLKKLSDQQRILFSPDRTNSMYVRDLTGQPYQSDFARLTLNYEYIWYGKFSLSNDQYVLLKNNFKSFNQKT